MGADQEQKDNIRSYVMRTTVPSKIRTILINDINFTGVNFSARKAGYQIELTIDGRCFNINCNSESTACAAISKIRKVYMFVK